MSGEMTISKEEEETSPVASTLPDVSEDSAGVSDGADDSDVSEELEGVSDGAGVSAVSEEDSGGVVSGA